MVTRRLGGCLLALGTGVAIGGCSSSSSPTQGNGQFGTLTPAANDPSISSPFDATPSLDGSRVYFTAIGADGNAGVFATTATGGGAITTVFSGSPLVSPMSIALSEDGSTLYVADSGATVSDKIDGGVIFSLPAAGGSPTAVGGTEGVLPHGIEVAGGQLYFSGTGSDGSVGVFSTPLGGGALSTLASGAPFVDPSGVTIAKNGDVYVVNTESGSSTTGSILKISGGQVSHVVDGIQVGYPAGVVLVQDESALLVSAYAAGKGTDAVLRVELGSRSQKYITQGIDQFFEPAGLHRAKNADIYAWADSAANNTGTVYVLTK